MIKILGFDSSTPEKLIIFVDLVQKSFIGQNATTGPSMYKCIKRALKNDTKPKFLWKANLVGSCTITNFNTVMAVRSVHIFPTYTYHDKDDTYKVT